MLNIFLNLKQGFTDADKEACKPVICRMLELSKIARKEGLLALEDEIAQEENLFLKTALALVVDGTEAKLLRQVLQYMCIEYSRYELLVRLVMSEGILLIQSGGTPKAIEIKLTAILGEKYLAQAMTDQKAKEEAERIKTAEQLLNEVKNRNGLPESLPFELILRLIPDLSVQQILNETDTSTITVALRICGYEMIKRTLENLPENRRTDVATEWGNMGLIRAVDAEYAQRKIIEKFDNLLMNENFGGGVKFGTIFKNLNGLNLSTEDMDLPVNVYNFLKRNSINTLEQLLSMSVNDLDDFNDIKHRKREKIYYIIHILQELSKTQKGVLNA